MKCALSEKQEKGADTRLLSFWSLIGVQSNTPPNNTRELEVATEENYPALTSTTAAKLKRITQSVIQVMESDLKTTEKNEDEQEILAIELARRTSPLSRKDSQKLSELSWGRTDKATYPDFLTRAF